ncbi:hypothetical protein [Terricaulis sp.]|uniref:hypothetical protein n=1 Tax=Terricaulis sp. TaxID=2768686 RepID=UPI0037841490
MALTDAQREAIYRIRRNRPASAGFFEHLAKLQHNMKKASLSVVEQSSGMNRKLSLQLMKEIAETGVASVRGGGGGEESYLAWDDNVDCREIGKKTDTPLR